MTSPQPLDPKPPFSTPYPRTRPNSVFSRMSSLPATLTAGNARSVLDHFITIVFGAHFIIMYSPSLSPLDQDEGSEAVARVDRETTDNIQEYEGDDEESEEDDEEAFEGDVDTPPTSEDEGEEEPREVVEGTPELVSDHGTTSDSESDIDEEMEEGERPYSPRLIELPHSPLLSEYLARYGGRIVGLATGPTLFPGQPPSPPSVYVTLSSVG